MIEGVLDYDIRRELNRIGTFMISIPAGALAKATLLRPATGWFITLTIEGVTPPGEGTGYLVYLGRIAKRDYVFDEGGGIRTVFLGDLMSGALAKESVHTGDSFVMAFPGDIAVDALDGIPAFGDTPSTIKYPESDNDHQVSVTYNDISRYEKILKTAEYGKYNVRDTFSSTHPLEYVSSYDLPFSGYDLVRVGAFDPGLSDATAHGIAIMGGTPTFAVNGQNVVNRVIPVGLDEPDGPLTLASATQSSPYEVQTGVNPDGTNFYYLEDAESVLRYGLSELPLQRTDVKNPSNDAGTRQAAANVLYAVASGTLLQRRSEILELTNVLVVNGADVWALPGDYMRVTASGECQLEDGTVLAFELHRRPMLITSRADRAGEGGARIVEFSFAAPLIDIIIPGLPSPIPDRDGNSGPVAIPPPLHHDPKPDPTDPEEKGEETGNTGGATEDCCPDPEVDVEEQEGPEGEGDPPPPVEFELDEPTVQTNDGLIVARSLVAPSATFLGLIAGLTDFHNNPAANPSGGTFGPLACNIGARANALMYAVVSYSEGVPPTPSGWAVVASGSNSIVCYKFSSVNTTLPAIAYGAGGILIQATIGILDISAPGGTVVLGGRIAETTGDTLLLTWPVLVTPSNALIDSIGQGHEHLALGNANPSNSNQGVGPRTLNYVRASGDPGTGWGIQSFAVQLP